MEGNSAGVSVVMTTFRTELPSLLAFYLGPQAHTGCPAPILQMQGDSGLQSASLEIKDKTSVNWLLPESENYFEIVSLYLLLCINETLSLA